MTLVRAEQLEFEEVGPRRVGRDRRVVVIVLGVFLATAACTIIGLTLVQGSWWYSYGTDRDLDDESRARVEAIRDEVDASGAVPKAVMWLNAALEPNTHPTDVRTYLLAALGALEAADDPKWAVAVEEIRAIIEKIRPATVGVMGTPYSAPTLEWPERGD